MTGDDEAHDVQAEMEVAAVLGLAPKSGLLELLGALLRHGVPGLIVAWPATSSGCLVRPCSTRLRRTPGKPCW